MAVTFVRPLARDTDDNQITVYQYDAAGLLASQTVLDPSCDGNATGQQADNQTTRYFYSWQVTDPTDFSPVPRSDLLLATAYPDCTLTDQQILDYLNGASGAPTEPNLVTYTYTANGAQATKTDQRGVVHEYVYDSLGRVTEDDVTSLGYTSGLVDESVLAIVTAYNDRGLTESVTSYDNATVRLSDDVVNQVVYAYNGWGNVLDTWQSHDGPADTNSTPTVQYAYDSLDRLTSVTYPTTGRVIGYSYGASGSIGDRLSRVAAITDGTGQNAVDLVDYTYLGLGTIIGESHPQVSGGLDLSYGTKDNDYSGLDQYGRIVDEIWANDAGTILDRYKYGYDAAGDRLWKENVTADAAGQELSEVYAYDELYRLIGTDRGHFSGGSFVKDSDYQDWTLDGIGNILRVTTAGSEQDQESNTANEITSTTTGGTTTAVTHDAAGNLTSDGTLNYTYDAWNRQVKVTTGTGESEKTVATYQFDGVNRRIQKTVFDSTGEAVTSTTDYYYNENWQVLEEQTRDSSGVLTSASQYVWDLSYIDTPVVRFRDTTGSGTFTEALYYTSDANHNVTAVVNPNGTVAERYVYDAYGKATFYDAGWSPEVVTGTSTPVSASQLGNEILYCGYRYDPETAVSTTGGGTGSYQVRNREYITVLSTWDIRDPMGYAAGDGNLYRYVGNQPTHAVDPSGCEGITVSDDEVTWAVQQPGWIWDTTVETLSVGRLNGDNVELSQEFGGGRVPVSELKTFADRFWRQYGDISRAAPGARVTIIRSALDRVRQGQNINESSTAWNVVSAAGTGAANGAAVTTDTLTFGYVAHERSQRVQREAIANGDILSQIGYGAGKVGARATQALVIVAVGQYAVGHIAATVAGKAILGSSITQGTLAVAQIGLTGVAAYSAVQNGRAAYQSARRGDYIGATEGVGNAGLSILFAGASARGAYVSGRAFLSPRISGVYEVPLGPGASPGSSQYVVGNFSRIGVTQTIAGQFSGPNWSATGATGACRAVSIIVVSVRSANPVAPGAIEDLPISLQKQAGHIPGTPQYANRISQGKTTSAFFGEESGNAWTQRAWQKGTPTGDPNIKFYDPRVSVGTGPNGGMQTQIRVVRDSQGRIHGTPWGPEQ